MVGSINLVPRSESQVQNLLPIPLSIVESNSTDCNHEQLEDRNDPNRSVQKQNGWSYTNKSGSTTNT